MSVIVTAVATESGVPIFSRKRGSIENVQFSTIASLHGVNMFSKCHNVSLQDAKVDNGKLIWKEYCKSITLIGMVTGGLECELEALLSNVFNVMILFIGKKELECMKNVEQIKRDLRQCYPVLDYLMESLDTNSITNSHPTLILDLTECMLCPQAQQLQQALDSYAECVTGRWACLSINGRLVAASSDFDELDTMEARLLLLLLNAQDGAPLRETPVFLPNMSPNVAFRAVTCKLLADVYILVVCGATPALSQIDEIVLQCWENYAQIIKEAKMLYPRNFPLSIQFDQGIIGILVVNISKRKCVYSRNSQQAGPSGHNMSATHRLDILRTFYVKSARDIVPELINDVPTLEGLCENYWCSEYHKCHAQRSENILCCVLYAPTVPTHTMRLVTSNVLKSINNNKEIYW